MKFQELKKGACIRGLGKNYAQSKFPKDISIFDVFKTLYIEKGVTSFFDSHFLGVLGIVEEH